MHLRLTYSIPQITPASSAWPQLLLPQLSIVTYILHIPFHRLHQRLLHGHSDCYHSFLLYLGFAYSFPQITPASYAWPQWLLPQPSIVLTSYIFLSTDYTSVFFMTTVTVTPSFYYTYVLYIPFHRSHQYLLHGHSYCYPSFLLYLRFTCPFPQIIPASSAWPHLLLLHLSIVLLSCIFLCTDYTSIFCMATVTATQTFYCTCLIHIPFHRSYQRLLHGHS